MRPTAAALTRSSTKAKRCMRCASSSSLPTRARIRRKQEEEQTNQAGCLNLVTNAVVAWNTVYMAAAIEQLKHQGYEVNDEDVRHLSPARYAHINPYGKYRFNIEESKKRKGLRALRNQDEIEEEGL